MKSCPFRIVHTSELTESSSLAKKKETKREKRPYKKIENNQRMQLLKLVRL